MSNATNTTRVLVKPADGNARDAFYSMSTIRRRCAHRASVARFLAKNAARLVTGWI